MTKNHLIKLACILLAAFASLSLVGCTLDRTVSTNAIRVESPRRYYKYIDVVITDIDARHWYASGHHFQTYLTVESDEYGLSESFRYTGSDAKEKQDWEEGDIVQAEMCSWVMESTGEVVERKIINIQ